MSNGIGKLNNEGQAFIVQTESPRSAHLHESYNPLPRRRAIGDLLGRQYGGTWTYVPGHGCRGTWSVEASTPDELVTILRRTEIPVTVYRYTGTEVSPELAAIADAIFCHNRTTGYYDAPVPV